jgi:hypothetical protein
MRSEIIEANLCLALPFFTNLSTSKKGFLALENNKRVCQLSLDMISTQ